MKFYVLDTFGLVAECDSFEEAETVLAEVGEDAWICNDDDEGHGFGIEDDYDPSDDWGYNEDEGFDPYMGDYSWDC